MMRITPAVKHLLILNVIIFVGTAFLGNKYFFDGILALYYPMSGAFEFWQIGTHMFMHGNLTHILFNMFALWMFGTAVEQQFGIRKFLIFYLSCGLGAVALTFLVYFIQIYPFFDLNVKSNGAMVGASGAIMGILVAFGMLNPNAELMLIFLPIPIKAKYFIPGIIVLDLISATTGVSFFSPSNTAYIAHIGGAVTGFLIMYFWKKNQFNKYPWN